MTRVRKKAVIVFALIAFVLVLALVIFTSLGPGSALPNPNGYDDFVKAGQIVTATLDRRRGLGDYGDLNLEELRVLASTNAEALRIARDALDKQCRVPVINSQDWFRSHLGVSISFFQITRVFCLAGRLAQLEGRTNDVVSIYLDLIRFAHESSRGGMITDNAVARTREALGMQGLESVKDSLDAAQNRRIAKVLEEIDDRRESWSDLLRRDVRYDVRAEFKSIFSLDSWQVRQRLKGRFYQAEHRRRQTMVDFAVRAYELETGSKPGRLTNLVPAYLKTIPQDPLNGTNFVYKP
jgi:hypothetical protein